MSHGDKRVSLLTALAVSVWRRSDFDTVEAQMGWCDAAFHPLVARSEIIQDPSNHE